MSGIKQPVELVELKPKRCSRTYGSSPCAAALGVTGNRKCFNTRTTCQDLPNFAETTHTLRFAEKAEDLPLELDAIPSLRGVSFRGSRLNVAGLSATSGPLGLRSAVSLTFQDHPDGDTATDPYLADRDYDPQTRGTFWPKWIARNQDWQDTELDVVSLDVGPRRLPVYNDGFDADTSGEWSRGFDAVNGTIAVASSSIVYTKGSGDSTRPRIVRPVAVEAGRRYRATAPAPTGTATNKQFWISPNDNGGLPTTDDVITPIVTNAATDAEFIAPGPIVYAVLRTGTDSTTGQTVAIDSVLIEPAETRRSAFLESVDGPDAQGRVTVMGRDILSRIDGKKVQAPRATDGALAADITATATQCWITDADYNDYVQQGGLGSIMRIGREIIRFATVTAGTGPENRRFTSLVRGLYGTKAEAHGVGATAQACLEFVDRPPVEILQTLLEDFGGIPGTWLPVADWEAEAERWLGPYAELSAVISEPTGVDELVGEIAESCMLYLWTDDKARLIRMRAVRPPEEDVFPLTDAEHILAGSLSRSIKIEEQISRAEVYFGMTDVTEKLDEERNYRAVRVRSGVQLGQPRARKIYSRWLKTDAQATQTARVLMNAANTLPVYVTCSVGFKDAERLGVGAVVELTTRLLQDDTGAVTPALFQLVEANERGGETMTLTLRSFGGFPAPSYYMASDSNDFADATAAELAEGCFYTDDDGLLGGNPSIYSYT